MGRKPLNPRNLRSVLVNIRLTKEEHRILSAKAKAVGSPLGTWLRELGMSAK